MTSSRMARKGECSASSSSAERFDFSCDERRRCARVSSCHSRWPSESCKGGSCGFASKARATLAASTSSFFFLPQQLRDELADEVVPGTFDRPSASSKLRRKSVQLVKTRCCVRHRNAAHRTSITIERYNCVTSRMWIQAQCGHEPSLLLGRNAQVTQVCKHHACQHSGIRRSPVCSSCVASHAIRVKATNSRITVSNFSPQSRYTDLPSVHQSNAYAKFQL